MVLGGDLGLPARLDDDGLVALDDERRAGETVLPGFSVSRRKMPASRQAPSVKIFAGLGRRCVDFLER